MHTSSIQLRYTSGVDRVGAPAARDVQLISAVAGSSVDSSERCVKNTFAIVAREYVLLLFVWPTLRETYAACE